MTSGRIVLDGSEISIRNPRHARALGISTIHQELHLVPQLSVAQNIFLGREPCFAPGVIDSRTLESMAQDMLNRLAVELDARARVRTLGIAQKQMVEVAKALSQDCRILVMDEPTSALSDREISELFSLIRRMKSEGVSVIYISHRLDEVIEIGDRVTVLRDGRSKGTCQGGVQRRPDPDDGQPRLRGTVPEEEDGIRR
jgi:ribose transport system ATP-binding protein